MKNTQKYKLGAFSRTVDEFISEIIVHHESLKEKLSEEDLIKLKKSLILMSEVVFEDYTDLELIFSLYFNIESEK